MTLTTAAGEDGWAEPQDGAEDATIFFQAIGKQVRLLRERAGLSRRELADQLGYSYDQIVSIESGRRTPQPEFLDAADDLLNAGGLLKATKEDVLRAKDRARVRHPAWFRDYARLEAQAVQLSYFSNQAIPGLLQTEGYARAVFSGRQPLLDEELIEQRVTARLARQEILTRWPAPVVTAVIQEAVLQQPFGGQDVHRGQLERLLELGRLRSMELQVMPTNRAEHAGMGGPFTLLTPKGKHQLVYLEVQHVSRLIADPDEVRVMATKYGSIRGQALTPWESTALIEKMLGAI